MRRRLCKNTLVKSNAQTVSKQRPRYFGSQKNKLKTSKRVVDYHGLRHAHKHVVLPKMRKLTQKKGNAKPKMGQNYTVRHICKIKTVEKTRRKQKFKTKLVLNRRKTSNGKGKPAKLQQIVLAKHRIVVQKIGRAKKKTRRRPKIKRQLAKSGRLPATSTAGT